MSENRTQPASMLSPYRVLDLTDDRGEIAAMVLGDLGADVIKVEPPGGSPARFCGPLLADAAATEQSLQFHSYNRNKRSIVLDLKQPADQETLLELVSSVDILFESFPDSLLSQHGIGFDELSAANPRLVHVQISPFGTDGPAANWPASDLTIVALGGPVALQGVIERAPLRVSVPQVWRHAGVEAAVAALVAHARMRQTGEAQQVDVSAQSAMTWTMLNSMGAAAIQGYDFERRGSEAQTGQIALPIIFECADGYVVAPPTRKLMIGIAGWLVEEGFVDQSWADQDWDEYEAALLTVEKRQALLAPFMQLCQKYRKNELLERGLEIGVSFAPVNTIADILDFRQLESRQYWLDTKLPNGINVRTPGLFAQPSLTPLSVRRSAPSLDEHGTEIRQELNHQSSDQNINTKQSAGTRSVSPTENQLPFEGLKVADFSWVGVGPISARCLADHGATVVRVESELRPDVLRGGPPFTNGEPGWNRSHFFGDFNSSKLGLLLNLKDEKAIEIAHQLIEWADVYIESFSPGTVKSLGIDYETARKINPDIIMVSTCLMGQSGPASAMAGFGYHAGAMAGFYETTGWPDLPPSGPWVAYTDTIAPRFLLSTLLAALDHRRRTGEGQHIDAAQFEMGLHFLAPEILDYQVNGHMAGRAGNRARDAAPQGVYPCAGDDNWCAIAVENDTHWSALRRVLGDPEWSKNPDFDSVTGRLENHDSIDEEIANWTRTQDRTLVSDQLLAAGIPAGNVQRSSDLLRDKQYKHRNFYQYLDHDEMGNIPYAGHQFRIKGYPSGPRTAAPTLGQHSVQVLQELLGMSDDEIANAFASGAIA
jgi:crotonobetainyl-CoA:carnitine CoA-transferase CaiB-like acyl-CoA transferase